MQLPPRSMDPTAPWTICPTFKLSLSSLPVMRTYWTYMQASTEDPGRFTQLMPFKISKDPRERANFDSESALVLHRTLLFALHAHVRFSLFLVSSHHVVCPPMPFVRLLSLSYLIFISLPSSHIPAHAPFASSAFETALELGVIFAQWRSATGLAPRARDFFNTLSQWNEKILYCA
ncbi:hypothetical protein HGRIS_003472 [Hohenbuehelia grisea]|uniref:Uncharacterized protein n=1 Tax=Hohenbuehelia grisea TaxID=104357 RepID=A0ABR3JH87_9AGAR